MRNKTDRSAPVLGLDGLGKQYDGLQALDDVSFEVERGSITSLIGPNGAGKTTLFNIVSGVIKPSSGSVRFMGEDITGMSAHKVCALGMGRTFQNVHLFPNLNAIENVIAARYHVTNASLLEGILGFPRDRNERRQGVEEAVKLLSEVGLRQEQSARMPSELPYGDRRRLEIARALATGAEFIILDEPTAGMSSSEVADIMSLIEMLQDSNRTILLIEHNVNLVMRISDKIVVLNFGKKIAEGSPEEVRRSAEVVEAYLGVSQS